MSELGIALVAEGPTDQIVIESALRAILGRPIVVTLLQPEPTRPALGEGWCGVLKWCLEQRGLGFERLEDDPTLRLYDLIVLHLDADVADKAYEHCGCGMTDLADAFPLPCAVPCPPAVATVDPLQAVLLGWLGLVAPGPRTVLCIPSKAIESWVAAAWLPADHALLAGDLECEEELADRLKRLPLATRIRKTRREYVAKASPAIRQHWATVRARCAQAKRFQQALDSKRPASPVNSP